MLDIELTIDPAPAGAHDLRRMIEQAGTDQWPYGLVVYILLPDKLPDGAGQALRGIRIPSPGGDYITFAKRAAMPAGKVHSLAAFVARGLSGLMPAVAEAQRSRPLDVREIRRCRKTYIEGLRQRLGALELSHPAYDGLVGQFEIAVKTAHDQGRLEELEGAELRLLRAQEAQVLHDRKSAAESGPLRFTVYRQPDGLTVQALQRDGVTTRRHVVRDAVDVINLQLSEEIQPLTARAIAETLREVLRGKEGTADPRDARIEQLEAALRSAKLEHQHHAVAQEGLIGRMKEERDQARAAQVTAQADSLQHLRAANNFSAALAEARRYIDKGDAAARTAVQDLLIRTEIAENMAGNLGDVIRHVAAELGAHGRQEAEPALIAAIAALRADRDEMRRRWELGAGVLRSIRDALGHPATLPLANTEADAPPLLLRCIADLKAKAAAAPDRGEHDQLRKCCIRNGGVIRNIAAKLGLQPTSFSTVEAAIIRRIDKLQSAATSKPERATNDYIATFKRAHGIGRGEHLSATDWNAACAAAAELLQDGEDLVSVTRVAHGKVTGG